MDWDLRTLEWNSGAEELLDHTPGEVIGCRCYDVLHGMRSSGEPHCYAACGRRAEAAQICRTALRCDPCRESFERPALRHLAALGRPDWAEADYRHWRRVMAEEMNMEITAETERLYRELILGAFATARNA